MKKKIARVIYNIYSNFWVELIGKMVAFMLIGISMFMVVVGSRIGSKKFHNISFKLANFLCIVLLFLWLLYKWAKHQIRDELKEEGLIDEEEDN